MTSQIRLSPEVVEFTKQMISQCKNDVYLAYKITGAIFEIDPLHIAKYFNRNKMYPMIKEDIRIKRASKNRQRTESWLS